MRRLKMERRRFRSGTERLGLYVPSPSPDFLHIILVLKQVPSDADPPSQVFASGPPLSPGNFPPLTQSKVESNATSYVKSTVLNASPVEFHKE
jgi:hypothetical protein